MFGVRGKCSGVGTNYYRRFPGDYLADTGSLNLLQHGAYTLLLDHLYATERRIATEQDAFRICRAATEEERWAVTTVLANFFKNTKAGFTNNRYEKELKTRKDWCKWQKTHRDRTPDKSLTVRPMSSRSLSPSPSPSEEESKDKTFHPPTQVEVCAYMQSRGIPDAERQAELFDAHHATRKWRLGGGKGPVMADWKRAVITWQANIGKFDGGSNGTRQSVAAGGSRTESFDERRRRKSEAVLSEVGARARAVVSEVERQLPLARRD